MKRDDFEVHPKKGFGWLIECKTNDGVAMATPLYLRGGSYEIAQALGPFTLNAFEAYMTKDEERAEIVASACNVLYPLEAPHRWCAVEHGFH